MFAGAAVVLLGIFLIASERELKVKRREIEALLTKLENGPQGSASDPAIQPQTDDASEIAQMENRRLSAANDQLTREINDLRDRLAAGEAQAQRSTERGHDAQEGARMQAEINGLRRALDQSNSKIRELETVRQDLPDVNTIESAHRHERESLQERIAELEKRLAIDQQKLAESQTLHDRLAEAENIQNSLRDEIRRHEEEIPRWQARILAAEENHQRLAALQIPCNELLSKQTALADQQRQLQEELVAFARLITAPADAPQNESPSRTTPPGSISSLPGSTAINDTAPEMRAAQDVVLEPAGGAAPGGTSGRRYGMLGALLIIAAAGALGFQLFSSGAEQSSKRPSIGNALEGRAPGRLPAPAMAASTQQPSIEIAPSPAPLRPAARVHTTVRENAAPAIINNQPAKAESGSMGTYQVIRPSQVYAAPSELSRSLGDIEPGINVNVVNARDGWLEIHSKHGRPPGFIRREVAARITGQN
jgi:hypothetical protein